MDLALQKRHKKYWKDAKDFIGGLRSKTASKNLKTHWEDIMWFHGVERHKKTRNILKKNYGLLRG